MKCLKNIDGYYIEEVCDGEVTMNGEHILPCCQEMFHLECLSKWLKENDTCPNCEQRVDDKAKHVQEINQAMHTEWWSMNPDTDKEEY
jgi:hypothetical protein